MSAAQKTASSPAPGQIEDVEVGRHVHPAEEVGEHGKRRGGDTCQARGQPVQPVGQIDRVARTR